MGEADETKNASGGMVAEFLRSLSQKSSRRGLLATIGKWILLMLGFELVRVLPLDRIIPKALANLGDCGAWDMCGVYGVLCKRDDPAPGEWCGQGDANHTCPNCANLDTSNFWSACCLDPTNVCRLVNYYDCCSVPDDTGEDPCTACAVDWCKRGSAQPLWGCLSGCPTKNGACDYDCTIAQVVAGPCGSC